MAKLSQWCGVVLLAFLLLAPHGAIAQKVARPYDVRVITSEVSQVTREIVQSIQRLHPTLQESSDPRAFAPPKGTPIYLAIGPSALRATLAADVDGPIVSLFTSSQTYTELVAGARSKRSVTGIYAEASPAHQLQLIAQLFSRRVTVGVLITEHTAYLRPILRQGALSAGVDLALEQVDTSENVVRAMSRVSSAAVLLAVPDSTLYTPANLRNILESTYRRNQPVVGFSTALVNAGTIATAYSTIPDTIAQLGEVLDAIAAGRSAEPQYPRYWRVAINENVARSLNIDISERVRGLGERPPERPR